MNRAISINAYNQAIITFLNVIEVFMTVSVPKDIGLTHLALL